MDKLQFTAEVIKALAWPAAVVIVAFMFKDKLRSLLDKIKHAKGVGFEVDFSEDLKKVTEEAEQVRTAAPGEGASNVIVEIQPLDEQRRLADLLRERPSALILDAWRDVEKAVQDVVAELGVETGTTARRNPPSSHWATLLQVHGVLTVEEAGVVTDLRALRNKVAHAMDWEPNVADAMDYYRTANLIVNVLRSKLPEIKQLKK